MAKGSEGSIQRTLIQRFFSAATARTTGWTDSFKSIFFLLIIGGMFAAIPIVTGLMTATAASYMTAYQISMLALIGVALFNYCFAAALEGLKLKALPALKPQESNAGLDLVAMVNKLSKVAKAHELKKAKKENNRAPRKFPKKITVAMFTNEHSKKIISASRLFGSCALYIPSGLINDHSPLTEQEIAALMMVELLKRRNARARRGFFNTCAKVGLYFMELIENTFDSPYMLIRLFGYASGPFQFFLLYEKSCSRTYQFEAMKDTIEVGGEPFRQALISAYTKIGKPTLDIGVKLPVKPEVEERCAFFLMSELPLGAVPAKNTIYLEKSDNKLKYVVLDPADSTKKLESTLDITIRGELTKKKLNNRTFKKAILEKTFEKGHTPEKPVKSPSFWKRKSRGFYNFSEASITQIGKGINEAFSDMPSASHTMEFLNAQAPYRFDLQHSFKSLDVDSLDKDVVYLRKSKTESGKLFVRMLNPNPNAKAQEKILNFSVVLDKDIFDSLTSENIQNIAQEIMDKIAVGMRNEYKLDIKLYAHFDLPDDLKDLSTESLHSHDHKHVCKPAKLAKAEKKPVKVTKKSDNVVWLCRKRSEQHGRRVVRLR